LSGFVAGVPVISVPVKTPGGKPVIDVPTVPRSPLITVAPVFVTLAELRTPNVAAEPRFIC
jgi:hypothetical protein